jgi:hypothetical protein
MNDYRIKGAFFENVKDTGPAFTGFVEIDGVKTSIALWPKTSAKGQNYLQVAEDKKKPVQQSRSPFRPRQPVTGNDPRDGFADDDQDVPF